jgi:predicted enzyme related to lactoylglutathione lyase
MTSSTTSGTSAPLTVAPGAPIWTDLATSDLDRAESFYCEVLGWSPRRTGADFGDYVNFDSDGAVVAGMIGNRPDSGFPDGWTTYLATADARATVAAAPGAGGRVVIEPMDVMDLGVMALLTDAGGAQIGLWQPGAHRGFAATRRAGAPVWHELLTREYAASVAFYERVLGWRTQVMGDTDEFRYTVQVNDQDEQLAGIMDAAAFLPEGAPAAWHTYWGCADVDATLATVERLGGRVVQPAEDTPYGRLATAADPTGATFKLSSVES